MKKTLLILIAFPLLLNAQITVTRSSFSNGSSTGTDGTLTVISLLGSSGILNSPQPVIEAPTLPASSILFSNVLSTSMQIDFTPGNGEQRLIVLKAGSAPTFLPENDAFYFGDLGNSEQAVYNGNGNSFVVPHLLPDTEYFVTIFEFNTDSTFTKYLTTDAPLANQRTLKLPNVYVVSPANNAINKKNQLNITAKSVTGATTYTIEISTDLEFSNPKVKAGGRKLFFDSLMYNQLYYTRVKTDLSPDYGMVTSFTTIPAESLAYIITPKDSAINQKITVNVKSNLVPLAVAYTIELNTAADFAGTSIVQTGDRVQSFTNLSYSTQYYSRVKTEFTENWGSTRTFATVDAADLSYVTSPTDSAIDKNTSLNISSSNVPQATGYTIQLSELADFSTIDFEETGPTRTLAFSGLKYNTTYFNRVKTDLSINYGEVRSFTTRTAESLTFVTSPLDGATDKNTSLNISSSNVPQATGYTIQLSESVDFNTIAFEMTGPTRTLSFSGLKYNTTYFNRVKTDLSINYGEVRSFTTRTAESLTFVTSPSNGALGKNTTLNVTSSNVPGASTYKIQLSESQDFTIVQFEKTGPTRTFQFSGLNTGTTYYNRVVTDLTTEFGEVRSFTTAGTQTMSAGRLAGKELEEEKQNKDFNVTVFPNPFREKLNVLVQTVDLQKAEITLLDLTGKIILFSNHETNSVVEIEKPMASGTYLIRVTTPDQTKVIRVVKLD